MFRRQRTDFFLRTDLEILVCSTAVSVSSVVEPPWKQTQINFSQSQINWTQVSQYFYVLEVGDWLYGTWLQYMYHVKSVEYVNCTHERWEI